MDGGEPEIEIQDSVGSEGYSRLDVSRAPVVVTLARYRVDIVNILLTLSMITTPGWGASAWWTPVPRRRSAPAPASWWRSPLTVSSRGLQPRDNLSPSPGSLSTVRKLGGGSFHPSTVMSAVKMAGEVGVEINRVLMEKVRQEESLGDNREKIGFL